MMLSKLKRKVRNSLPPLPEAAAKITEMARDPDVSASQIAEVLESDPVLATKVLKVANSSFFGLSRKVSTVKQAVIVLGIMSIRNFALCASMTSLNVAELKKIKGFWRHSISTAIAARMLAEKLNPLFGEEYFLAGLLHDVGKLALLKLFGDDYASMVCAPISPSAINSEERKAVGIDHSSAGAELLEHWQLPEVFIDAVRYHHRNDSSNELPPEAGDMPSVVAVASAMAVLAGFGCGGIWCEPADLLRPLNGRISTDKLISILARLPEEVAEAEKVLEVKPARSGSAFPKPEKGAGVLVKFKDGGISRNLSASLEILGWRPQAARETSAGFEMPAYAGSDEQEASSRQDILDLDSFMEEHGYVGFDHLNLLELARTMAGLEE